MIAYRASHFALVHGVADCWSCKTTTPVAAILLDGYELRWEEDDAWAQGDGPVVLTYVTHVTAEAAAKYQLGAPWVGLMPSKIARETYWGNACTQCHSLQGDWHLHEPDAPFFPTDPNQEDKLTLTWHELRLEAVASGAQSSWMDRLVERMPRG